MSKGHLLDTCAWLDLNIAPELLSTQARVIIRKTDYFALSSISILEVSRKASLGKLTFSLSLEDWVSREFMFIPPAPMPEPEEPLVEAPEPVVSEEPAPAPVVVAVAATPVPPRPTPTPVAPSQAVDLVPLPGQGKIVRREGRLRSYLLKGSSPSKYYLSAHIGGRQQIVCFVENKEGQLKGYRGKQVIIQGHEYWVQGQDRPVIVPRAIIAK